MISSTADLANDGGPCSPSDTPAEIHDENSIKHNIDSVADDGSPQRGLGITKAPEHPLQCNTTLFACCDLHSRLQT